MFIIVSFCHSVMVKSGGRFPAIFSAEFAAATFAWGSFVECTVFRWRFLSRPQLPPPDFQQCFCHSSEQSGSDSRPISTLLLPPMSHPRWESTTTRERGKPGRNGGQARVCPLLVRPFAPFVPLPKATKCNYNSGLKNSYVAITSALASSVWSTE